jgi:hypothetical protein
VIAVDTNILVYAHRRDSPFHPIAKEQVGFLANGRTAWALPWPCIHEFLTVATHPRIYSPPSTIEEALAQVDAWMASPSVVMLSEARDYWAELRRQALPGLVTGPRIHDARIAAICVTNGVRELWSADRDFGRFTGLKVVNPLVGA